MKTSIFFNYPSRPNNTDFFHVSLLSFLQVSSDFYSKKNLELIHFLYFLNIPIIYLADFVNANERNGKKSDTLPSHNVWWIFIFMHSRVIKFNSLFLSIDSFYSIYHTENHKNRFEHWFCIFNSFNFIYW